MLFCRIGLRITSLEGVDSSGTVVGEGIGVAKSDPGSSSG